MEILIISGLSGSGKSRAATYLEDVGYYTVDNLPAEMMLRFADFCAAAGGRYDKLAFVYDVRVGEPPENLTAAVSQLRVRGNRCRLLFLEADTPTIIRRYKETRRSHPLCADGCSIETAVSRERELLRPVRDVADVVLDTSAFSTAKLRSTLLSIFAASGGALHVNVLSFGFKNGLPPEADLVLDVRCLPNPFYIPELKHKTGLDEEVVDFVMGHPEAKELLRRYEGFLEYALPLYVKEGKSQLTIAVGCTGGKHRSITFARKIAEYCKQLGYQTGIQHRDAAR